MQNKIRKITKKISNIITIKITKKLKIINNKFKKIGARRFFNLLLLD